MTHNNSLPQPPAGVEKFPPWRSYLPIAATVEDPFSLVVHHTSPISNPKAAHATCKYAWIRSGSMIDCKKSGGPSTEGEKGCVKCFLVRCAKEKTQGGATPLAHSVVERARKTIGGQQAAFRTITGIFTF
jgi:hypothetical protein